MKELTYEKWIKNSVSREMWVWNGDERLKEKLKVVYFFNDKANSFPILAVNDAHGSYASYQHCGEIKEPKYRRMTSQELAWWLRAKPTREMKYTDHESVYFEYSYYESEESVPVDKDILIRENGGEWREPLVEVEE